MSNNDKFACIYCKQQFRTRYKTYTVAGELFTVRQITCRKCIAERFFTARPSQKRLANELNDHTTKL
jgi:FPC/CPF motif-containing protein YcgG